MRETDRVFGGFLRMLIARMKSVIAELQTGNYEEALKLMESIMTDLQNTLED